MREILFRGKRVDNDEWVEGWLFKYMSYLCIGWEHGIECDYDDGGLKEHTYAFVIPETVGQYTGVTDKNGKKIFEGDRIEIRGYVYYCCWDEGNLEYILINEKESLGMGYAASSRMTVIGNVHDNPRLWEADDGS